MFFFFNTELKVGKKYYLRELEDEFKCSNIGRIRHSGTTNTLLLVMDNKDLIYRDKWIAKNVVSFAGMGDSGDQSLEFIHNETLNKSNELDIRVYLTERVLDEDKYIYHGEVKLIDEPKTQKEGDRNIYYFNLMKLSNFEDVKKYLYNKGSDILIRKSILRMSTQLNKNSVATIVSMMKEDHIDTLVSEGGWFFTSIGCGYNPRATGQKYIRQGDDDSISKIFEKQNNLINPFYKKKLGRNAPEHEDDDIYIITKKNMQNHTFKVRSLQVEHSYLGDFFIDLEDQNLNNDELSNQGIFFSTLIGINGSGKSSVLQFIQDIFLSLIYSSDNGKSYLMKECAFSLKYEYNGEVYEITKELGEKLNSTPILHDGEYKSVESVHLPNTIITNSFVLNDKFNFKKHNRNKAGYKYLGIRTSETTGNIKSLNQRMGSQILKGLNDNEFIKSLKNGLEFIKVDEKIDIIIKGGGRNKFSFYKKSTYKGVLSLDECNLIDKMIVNEFIRPYGNDNKKLSYVITVDLTRNIINDEVFYKMIDNLAIKGFLEIESLMFYRGTPISINDMSSGENHFVTSLVTIASEINDGALVLIDEPEISLHPNWQNRYIDALNASFKNRRAVHFIIATHSQFVVSNLGNNNTSLTMLFFENNHLYSEVFTKKTYGWSAEEILLKVFKMPSTRNYYLASILDELLAHYKQGKTFEELSDGHKEHYKLLNAIKPNLNEDDPLRKLVIYFLEKANV